MTMYADYGVTPVINASGYVTRLGGSLMLPAVVEAMAAASRQFVSMAELEEAAGRMIADLTGAEAGYVTSGSAAALTLAAAVCIARSDRQIINRLPDTRGIPNEIVIPGPHRDPYDRCLRIAGARIVTAGTPEHCSPEDIAAAIGDRTVAVGWFSAHGQALPLATVVEVARAHGVAVIVDAALALPPPENLRKFVEEGADLVAFSGGKDLRGPQTTGFLAGRADLIAPLALHHQDFAAFAGTHDPVSEFGDPGHGLGRPMKVGKEELVGLLIALHAYAERDHAGELDAGQAAVNLIAERLADLPGLTLQSGYHPTPGHYLDVTLDPVVAGTDAATVAERLLSDEPRVAVAYGVRGPGPSLRVGTVALAPGEAVVVARRISEIVAGNRPGA